MPGPLLTIIIVAVVIALGLYIWYVMPWLVSEHERPLSDDELRATMKRVDEEERWR